MGQDTPAAHFPPINYKNYAKALVFDEVVKKLVYDKEFKFRPEVSSSYFSKSEQSDSAIDKELKEIVQKGNKEKLAEANESSPEPFFVTSAESNGIKQTNSTEVEEREPVPL